VDKTTSAEEQKIDDEIQKLTNVRNADKNWILNLIDKN
jgi:hypothetical protein